MKKKSIISRALAVVGAMVLSAAVAVGASASGEWIDLNKKGSISVTMHDSKNTAIAGGEMTLYKVADVHLENEADLSFVLTNGFAASGVKESELTEKNFNASALVSKFQKGITSTAVSTKAEIGKDGKVSFSNLDLGIYLLVQNKAADGYNAVNPFLVTVPMQENGSYIYTVDATPKVEAATAAPTVTPAPTTVPTTGNKLPQTGQLDWPVPVMACMGVLLFSLGFYMQQKEKREYAA